MGADHFICHLNLKVLENKRVDYIKLVTYWRIYLRFIDLVFFLGPELPS